MAEDVKPPYVRFEYRAIEDRTQSIETGHYTSKDVAFAIVTPPGSRDTIEKNAEDWLRDLKQAVAEERFPQTWYMAYEQGFRDWLKTNENPEFGTALRDCGFLSPAQLKNVFGANIRTVEELAEANENALNRMGMGARALKEKAQAWLDTSNGKGKVASELAALRQSDSAKNSQIEEMQKTIEDLRKTIEALKKEPV